MVGSALGGVESPFSGTPEEALDAVESVLIESSQRRMVSDVPLGAMLSGGIDSSLVVAMMQKGSTKPVKTFTIGMDEPGYNETGYARAVAAHLGTEHHELVLSPAQIQSVIPDIASIYDEPFADSSQVPTFLVSRMAREEVTVALSGDGGDELFAGYNRYSRGASLWSRLEGYPPAMRHLGATLLRGFPPTMINGLVSLLGPLAPEELAAGRAGEKLHKLAGLLTAADQFEFHDRLLTTGYGVESLAKLSVEPSVLASRKDSRETVLDFTMQAILRDTANYLPDDILTKVDRASMAVGLEVRAPFLQRELFELAWSLPMTSKISGGQGKTILRELLYRYVPQSLLDRPKAGFAIPVGRWMRGQLREWAEDLLSRSALEDAGVFEPDMVRKLWAEQISGRRDHETLLWSVLMYQGWRCAEAGD
jgi:asparagine synthase (glutamine-hydrolysing)